MPSQGLRCALAAAILLFGTACRQQPTGEPEGPAAGNQVETPTVPVLPLAEPPIDRAGLLGAVARAASMAALGQDDRQGQRQLDGRRVEVRLRFGCPENGEGGGHFAVHLDPGEAVLRVRAAPDLTLDDPLAKELVGTSAEAVEGFWIAHPWLLEPGCPASPARSESAASSQSADEVGGREVQQRVGIAQVFAKDEPRTHRRDRRAYEVTSPLPPDARGSTQGLDLVLSGRLRGLADGRVIACKVDTASAPPDCIISAEIDQVRIETPVDQAIIAEWRS